MFNRHSRPSQPRTSLLVSVFPCPLHPPFPTSVDGDFIPPGAQTTACFLLLHSLASALPASSTTTKQLKTFAISVPTTLACARLMSELELCKSFMICFHFCYTHSHPPTQAVLNTGAKAIHINPKSGHQAQKFFDTFLLLKQKPMFSKRSSGTSMI